MDRHILIAGQGRAGTTLFYNMLRQTLQGFRLPAREVPAAGYVALPGSYVTKRPLDIFDIPGILKLNDNQKRVDLIVSLRDPRDLLTSRHASVPDDYFCHADRTYFVPPDGSAPMLTNPGLIPTHHAIAEVAMSGVFPQGVFLLKYERLVADPEAMQAQLARDLGLEFEGRFSDFHKAEIPADLQRALNGVRPVQRTEIPRWQRPEHRARIIDQFTRFPELFDILVALDYEDDNRWFDSFRAAA
ncbi:hypothetical protein [Roseivivax isoporae]|uniref:Sulfotransferase domain-containing protein n=1 Tax=Roseivivax isoporae LMG 25204 TaxID=1449351 RepID=X7F7J1_9RHOB|nr:hypothetical protein [Roseivivax isoporae]ETX28902.1 hypothetical protein RISW2_04105 [Roseivivax isoporae LMG 25204]